MSINKPQKIPQYVKEERNLDDRTPTRDGREKPLTGSKNEVPIGQRANKIPAPQKKN